VPQINRKNIDTLKTTMSRWVEVSLKHERSSRSLAQDNEAVRCLVRIVHETARKYAAHPSEITAGAVWFDSDTMTYATDLSTEQGPLRLRNAINIDEPTVTSPRVRSKRLSGKVVRA